MEIEEIEKQAALIRRSFIDNMVNHLIEFEIQVGAKKNFDLYWTENSEALLEQLSSFSSSGYTNFCFSPPLLYLYEKLKTKMPKCKNISIEGFESSDENADFLVVKGDYGVVENGNIVLLDNAAQNSFNQLKHLFIILNISDFVVKQYHLDYLLYLKERQRFFTDIRIISSAHKRIESDAFVSTYSPISEITVPVTVFLVDDGVTQILKDPVTKPVLNCINCGICSQVCPVYQINRVISPINLVKTIINDQDNKKQNIAQLTTLCGNCSKACPIHIPLAEIMQQKLQETVKFGFLSRATRKFNAFFTRAKMNKLNDIWKNYLFINKQFGKNRILKEYFNKQKFSFFNIQQKDESSE